MAGPQEILVGRYARRLQRLFSMKGDAPVTDVAAEIVAVVDAQGSRLDDYYLADERLCSGLASIPANVGFRSELEVLNPAGSGILVVVERAYVTAGPTTVAVRLSTSPPFDIVAQLSTTKFWRDTRIGAGSVGAGAPAAQVLSDNTRVVVAAGVVLFVNTTNQGNFDLPYVLAPGSGLTIEPNADNLAMTATFHWRERPFEPSEA
jgi:hypothetical protein